jgi:hypothetical protein
MRKVRRGTAAAFALLLVLVAVAAATVAKRGPDTRGVARNVSAELVGAKASLPYGAAGASESGEAFGAAAQDYENRAYPNGAVAFAQTQGSIKAAKAVLRRAGAKLPKAWDEVGTSSLDVDVLGTQHFLRGTEWSGRVTAMQVDAKHCDLDGCKLYVASAGGGVWRTNDALAATPTWKEISTGLDSYSIGTILIDPTDPTGNTLYVGTGEPNGSSENEAGIGMYRSTDSGNHWSLVAGSVPATKDRGIGAIAIDPANANHIFVGTTVARHGASAVFGGRLTPPGAPPIGLYESKDGGASFTLLFSRAQDVVDPNTANGTDFQRGAVTDIEFDPNDASAFYFTMTNNGVFRGTVGATTGVAQVWTEPNPHPAQGAGGLTGVRYQLATADLPSGKTRIYLGQGTSELGAAPFADASKLWRTDDAAAATGNASWTLLSNNVNPGPGFSSWDFCRTQCSYDMPVASPPGRPDEVWIGGATQYQELPTRAFRYRSNGRAVMRSTNAGVQFTDQTGDARHEWEAIHPDIHEFAFGPNGITFIGSDGGVTRTNGTYVDFTSDCDNRNLIPGSVADIDCRTWLASIPERLITMNKGLATLQLQDIAVDPTDPYNDLITGTQDNGSPYYDGSKWALNVQGDGAPPAIDSAGTIHYHQYSGEGIDVNFTGTTSGNWIWIGDPLLFSPEGAAVFYGPLIADPSISKTAFAGLQHVWRTKKAGGDQAFLEAHCNTNTGDRAGTGPNSGCGDWTPLGGTNNAADAGNLAAGPDADKGGGAAGFVSALARFPGDTGTLWAATRRGRLWITENADAEPASAVTWTRLDTPAQPRRFPSGISVDPTNRYHAFDSFSGFDAYTPAQPGHVFEVTYNPATHTAAWKDISYDLGDQPILDVAYDAATGDVYAATDFGVDRLAKGLQTWLPAADKLPPASVYALTLAPGRQAGDRLLYAATHGRGAWRTELPKAK